MHESSLRDPSRSFFLLILLRMIITIAYTGLVIHDDQAPPHRGDRLACAGIRIRHPVRASVRYWSSGPAVASNASGFIRFEQETPFDLTEVKIDVGGLGREASGYHVHRVTKLFCSHVPSENPVAQWLSTWGH